MADHNLKRLTEEFFKLENNLDLLKKKIHGAYFWERVRFPVYQQLRESVLREEKDSDGMPAEYLSGISLLVKNIFMRNPFISQETELLFYGTGRRKKYEDGLWWDIYHDPVMNISNQKCLLWERPYKVSHLTPTKTSNIKYVDIIEYMGTLLQKTGFSAVSLSDDELSLIEDIQEEISIRFGVEISLKKIIKEDLSKRKVRLPLYEKLIKKVNPQAAFLTVGYNGRETFIEACKSAGVPVIELQHGVISKYHLGYSFPYDTKNLFADYFFSFGEFWSDSVDLPLHKKDIYPVGFPHLERKSQKYGNTETKEMTVFISQPTIGKKLSSFAADLSSRQEYENEIIYKLHPNEADSWKNNYPWLLDSDIKVVEDDPSLYQIFSESTEQVGVYSTALYEGLYFGLDTYILDAPGHEYTEYLIRNNYVSLVSSVEDYLSKKYKKDGNKKINKKYFFNDNPERRIKSAIKNITDEQYQD
jgi:hypothetical protein